MPILKLSDVEICPSFVFSKIIENIILNRSRISKINKLPIEQVRFLYCPKLGPQLISIKLNKHQIFRIFFSIIFENDDQTFTY
mgnify:CR=1 FL=1